jgi:hypothetical protein
MDSGTKRNVAHFLAFGDFKDSKNLGAAIRLAYELDVMKTSRRKAIPPKHFGIGSRKVTRT